MTTLQAHQVWDAVLGELQLQVTRPSYETWLKGTVGVAYRDGEFIVGTPSAFAAEMLEQRMYSLILHAMERVTKEPTEVRFQVLAKCGANHGPVPFNGTKLNGAGHPNPPSGSTHDAGPPDYSPTTYLNPKYVFDAFIVGKSNELAHAAAVAVSEKPGVIYNPLVIYSEVGLGKTHLLHAIGHRVRSRGASVIYATTEEFTNHYIKAIREGNTEGFRNRYRSTDVLLLDDIQFLIGKEQTQEGFFHTFNALHMSNRQIVISSDRPVSGLTLLDGRVRSRLAGGLVVDIQSPDLETRLAILRAKSEQIGELVAPEVIQFLGERVHKNIRELEGTLNRIVAFAQMTQAEVTLSLVRGAVADAANMHPGQQTSPAAILDAVAAYFQVDRAALEGPRGKKNVSLARQVAMYLLRQEANVGPTAIGRMLGGRDHSTVVKDCAKVALVLDVDHHLRRDILNIRDGLVATRAG